MTNQSVWVVDDDKSIRFILNKALTNAGMRTHVFESAYEMLDSLEHETPAVILTDVRMPGIDGYQLLNEVKAKHPDIPVVVMTAYSDLDSTVKAFREGAFEYLPKPFDINDVEETLRRALKQSVVGENIEPPTPQTDDIVGTAPAMRETYRAIARLSQSSTTVLITGESGTGKELIAKALHKNSPRKQAPMVALNMAALPNELIESELFGHEKGAFTGAMNRRIGLFEQANLGTLFLDEIGDMPLSAQTRLLRVLADGTFYRIGGRETIQVDVRIIAATNGDLEDLVQEGSFREDLYHRLNVIRIHVPPLRDRISDIESLATKFLKESADELSVDPKILTPDSLAYLEGLDWPGNVRQLENTCRWLTVMAPSREVLASDLPPELRNHTNEQKETKTVGWNEHLRSWIDQYLERGGTNLRDATEEHFETTLIQAALQHSNGHRQKAAKLAGFGRNTLSQKISKYNIDD